MRKRFLGVCGMILAVAAGASRPAIRNPSTPTIKETFEAYTDAILKSDLNALFKTVTEKDKFFFLTSQGRLIDTRQGYYKFHEDWFKEKDWKISFELLEAVEGGETGYTNAIYRYQGKTADGKTSFLEAYFTMIFRKEENRWKVVVDVQTPIRRGTFETTPELAYTPEQQYFFEMMTQRRTVRRFLPTAVPKEHVLKILDAARAAATAGNQQPWKFLVVQDRSKLDRLKEEALAWYLESYQIHRHPDPQELNAVRPKISATLEAVLSAPVYVAVLVDSQAPYPDCILFDGTLAAGNLMAAARALGYGTGFFTTFFPEKPMKKFFAIPDKFRLICFTPIGVPEKWPPAPPKKKLEDFVVFESF